MHALFCKAFKTYIAAVFPLLLLLSGTSISFVFLDLTVQIFIFLFLAFVFSGVVWECFIEPYIIHTGEGSERLQEVL